MTKEIEKLSLLRDPFKDNQISQLPKPTCRADIYKKLPKASCSICGGYHATTKTIHLAYVGHAALTDRLLDVDPLWTWEPLALSEHGIPVFDQTGGLWIKLTICGHTRLGYGNAKPNPYAEVGSREKEVIGDALRNAAMRFGAALDLWHKGDLHIDEDNEPESPLEKILTKMKEFKDIDSFQTYLDKQWTAVEHAMKDFPDDWEKAEKAMTNQLSKLTAEKL